MHDNRALVEGRIERFARQFLPSALYHDARPLSVAGWRVPDEPVPAGEALAQRYEQLALPRSWGRPWSTWWFRGTGLVPDEWFDESRSLPANARLEVIVDLGFSGEKPGFQAEGLAYRTDGSIIKAVSPRSSHVPWDTRNPVVDLFVEAAANPDIAGDYSFRPTSLGEKSTSGNKALYTLRRFDIALLDLGVWELIQDVRILMGLMEALSLDNPRRWEILRALERMVDVVDVDNISGTAHYGRELLTDVLDRPAVGSSHSVVAIGHAHIDTAWLWPVRETIRKCARTFSNVLELMDTDPAFQFACSSAQQLAWMKQFYPAIFARIAEKVASGQFILVGGMWVEPDINMPGGESMARQFVAGKRFFIEEFGVETQEAWIPDAFGYSGAFPQIIAASGSKWFFTQKISWNQSNSMPHHTFLWEGIDGTRIFTHFPPVDTYMSELSPAQLIHAESGFREAGSASLSLVPFGWGDGGGGPTREMLAAATRLTSLEGSPTVRIDSPQRFFECAEAEYENPPVWSGELYLELHRGVFTSQHRTKQGNRRNEHLLREAELWCTMAAIREGVEYPYGTLEDCWHTVLQQQFHDILPGTCIAWVHREVEANHADVTERLNLLIDEAVTVLAGNGDRRLIVNARPTETRRVPALGIDVPESEEGAATCTSGDGLHILDNGIVRAMVDSRGLLVSLSDASTGREAIAFEAPANLLQLFRDIPNRWDAWDIDEHYRRVGSDITAADAIHCDHGPGSAAVVIDRSFGASRIRQTLRLHAGASALEIHNEIDWHEKHHLLKLAFPLDIRADRSASETQFGHVFRPTYENTSWDAARFEVCAHRWVQVAEPGYGIAIANESTYGHDITRETRRDGGTTTTVRLSLLRSPTFPDPISDQGKHTINLSVRPAADIRQAVEEGYRMNVPLRTVSGARSVSPLVRVSHPAVMVEAVKLAEDRSGDVIVRLYESEGARADTDVDFDMPAQSVVFTDLLERPVSAPKGTVTNGIHVSTTLRPFQLVTLRVSRGATTTRDHCRQKRR